MPEFNCETVGDALKNPKKGQSTDVTTTRSEVSPMPMEQRF